MRELIVVSHTLFVLLQLQLFIAERCKIEGISIVYDVDNVDDDTNRRILTNLNHNGKI